MPRLKAEQMGANHNRRRDSDWCSGCGLHHYVHGEHRADCTKPSETDPEVTTT